MALTASDLTRQEWLAYHPERAFHQHSQGVERSISARQRRAFRIARRAARLLKEQFSAQSVCVFGSLARSGAFTLYSDIDLAAWGIPAQRFYAAVAGVTGLSAEFRIDLVDANACPPALSAAIEAEGLPL
jgi:predicted nucleotidyltransferase